MPDLAIVIALALAGDHPLDGPHRPSSSTQSTR